MVDLGASPRLDPPSGEVNFPFTVTASDPEQFKIICGGAQDDIDWHLELDWTCAGRHGTVVIDAEGNPFRVYPKHAMQPHRLPPALRDYLVEQAPPAIRKRIGAWSDQVERMRAQFEQPGPVSVESSEATDKKAVWQRLLRWIHGLGTSSSDG